MKRHITYIAMLLTALTGASCSQDETPAGDGRTGVMAMTISTSRTETNGEYDPLQYQKVYIYNSEGGLLRKYAAKDDIPERLELLSGTYRVAVEAGEEVPADFSKRFYKGEETFTVKPGETTNAEVVCKIANTVVEVEFDASIVENLDPGYFVWIAGTDKFDEAEAESGAVPALKFTDEGTGYYTLPAGTTSLAWMFRGTHTSGKEVEMENMLTEVKAGGNSYDLLTGTHEGISFSPTDKYNTELTLSDAFFGGLPGGDHAVTIHVEDANGGSNEISTTYRLQGLVPVTEKSYDLWANTVTLQVVDFTRSANVTFGLCGSDGQWKYQTGTSQGDDFISATFAPQWQESTNANGHTVYTRETGTGVVATHGYDYKVTIDGTEKSGSFTAGAAQTIPNADMSGWSMTSGFAFPNAEGGSFWSSGNNTMTKTLCTSTDVKFGKAAPAAKLTSTNMLVLAAGNLFTGTFAYKSLTGTVQFGQPYDFTVRPSALKVKYHAKVGTVDKVRTSGDICPYIKKGDPDMARIFVAIVDWNAPHQVVSAMTTTKGAWDPEKGIDNVSEGKILGYGSLWITQSTEGDDMQDAELEIVWYDHETRPSGGGYSLVISCACNAYGDYFTGCSTNVMYVDDFEWVY